MSRASRIIAGVVVLALVAITRRQRPEKVAPQSRQCLGGRLAAEGRQIPEAYACCEGNKGPGTQNGMSRSRGLRPSRPLITFIGVWDTVGALGAP